MTDCAPPVAARDSVNGLYATAGRPHRTRNKVTVLDRLRRGFLDETDEPVAVAIAKGNA
jgi:hypothetical protein